MKQSRGMSGQSLDVNESPEAGGTASSQSVSESGLHPLAAQLAPEMMYWSTPSGDGDGEGGGSGGAVRYSAQSPAASASWKVCGSPWIIDV